MDKKATEKAHDRLVEDITALYNEARIAANRESNERLLHSYWNIGRLIVDEEQKGAPRAEYGTSLLRSLAADLSRRFRQGFSLRNLQYIRLFSLEYELGRLNPLLNWTHYRELLAVSDPARRTELEDRAAACGMSGRELRQAVHSALDAEKSDAALDAPRLNRPGGGLSRYEVGDKAEFAVSSPGLFLDLGFRVRRLVSEADPRGFEPGDVVEVRGSGKRALLKKLDPAEGRRRFVYAARAARVVDGDTILARIELGFSVHLEMKLRLRGVDAPALGTAEGDKVRRYVSLHLRRGDAIAIRTYKHDPFDRYVADIFYDPKRGGDPARIFASGRFLNDELLQKGLALRYAPA